MMHRCFSTFALAGALLAGPQVRAQSTADAPSLDRPRTCLVLSGGGARGVAHIGVLKVLEELRVPIDCLVGTSMGAIIGGAWASGRSAAEIEKLVRSVDWDQVLDDDLPRPDRSARAKELERLHITRAGFGIRDREVAVPAGVLVGQQLEPVLHALAGPQAPVESFDELPIPFRAIATDIETGRMVVLERGSVTASMRASMSVPGVFAPQEIDGTLLADGGLVRNLGIDVARDQLGAERVIAINLGTPLLKREQLGSLFGMTEQMLNILTEQNVNVSREEIDDEHDVLIEPDLGGFSSADFEHSSRTIEIGERAAREAADRLAPYTVPDPLYVAWLHGRHDVARVESAASVRVATAGLRRVAPESAQAIFSSATGDDRSEESLRRGVRALYRTEDFELVSVRIDGAGSAADVIVEPREKSWGPNYARFGLTLSTDGEGESAFNVLADLRGTWLNRSALEWRTTASLGDISALRTELLQPLDLRRKVFVAGAIDFGQRLDEFFIDDRSVARYRNRGMRAGFDFGRYIGTLGEARIGYEIARVSSRLISGLAAVPNSEDDIGAVRALFVADRLDNWDFPRRGYYFSADVRNASEELGGDLAFMRYELDAQGAFGIGRHGVVLAARFGESTGDGVSIVDAFDLGGFHNLSGAQERQLLGRDVLFGRLVYRYHFGGLQRFVRRLFAGGSLEAGRIQELLNRTSTADENLRLASSLFVAAETPLGPLYLGGGMSEGGDRAFYLFFGRP